MPQEEELEQSIKLTKSKLITKDTQNRIDKLRLNKSYISAYLESLEEEIRNFVIKEISAIAYRSEIIRFIEYFEQMGIGIDELIEKLPKTDEIERYVESKGVDADSVFRIALKGLFKEVNKTTNTNIGINIIDEAINKLPGKKEPKRKARPLSINEIIEIRNNLLKDEKYQLLFTFEMFYAYGITLDDIETFGNDHYSLQKNEFTIPGKGKKQSRKIKLSKVLIELLDKHPELLEPKSRGLYSNNRKEVGFYSEREKFMWYDIIKTREFYFPACPKCKEKYPNSDEFWALVKYEIDKFEKKWFICRDCASKMVDGKLNE